MTAPLVTAAFTAWNAEETIAEALASALAQDWPRLEIVVVDDGSTDGTAAIVMDVARAARRPDCPIRLVRLPENGGVARARNAALAAAAGEFVAFFDDDDLSLPTRVSRQVARILAVERASGNDLVLCHAARRQVFPDGSAHLEPTMGCEGDAVPEGRAIVERILIGRLAPGTVGSCATCSQMARASTYRRLGGFDPAFRRSEDTELNVRCGLMGGAMAGIAEPLVVQRMTAGGEKTPGAEIAAHAALLEKHRAVLEEAGWSAFSDGWREVRRVRLEAGARAAIGPALRLGLRHPAKMAMKLVWSLPARRARRRQRSWYRSAFADPADRG